MRTKCRRKLVSIAIVGLAALAEGAQAICLSVNADVTADTTWGAPNDCIVLEQPIFVRSGATLTILPGTVVRGQPRSGPATMNVTENPGALIVTTEGRIIADGSASNPIIFTTAAIDDDNDGVADDVNADDYDDRWTPGSVFLDDTPATAPLAPLDTNGDRNASKWAGLVVLGRAPSNLADDPGGRYGTPRGQFFPGFTQPGGLSDYCDRETHDNSGILRFVSIRHGGDDLGGGPVFEPAALTLGCVGDGTIVEYIDVYAAYQDGIRWEGGTVNGNHLHVAFAGDDALDVDWGYAGSNQFVFVVLPFFRENDGEDFGPSSTIRGCELDGDDFTAGNVNVRADYFSSAIDNTPWPFSDADFWNMTMVGSSLPGTNPAVSQLLSDADGCVMRNGFAGDILNSIIVNTGTNAGIELSAAIGQSVPGNDVVNNVNGDLIRCVSSTLDDGAAPALEATTCLSNGDVAVAAGSHQYLGGTPNVVNNAAFAGLVNEDQSFVPTGNFNGKLDGSLKLVPMDPRPAPGLIGLTPGPVPADTGLDRAGTYRGAFPRSEPLWTGTWTALGAGGILQ